MTTLAPDRSVSAADASPNAPLPVDAAVAAIIEKHGEAERTRAAEGVRRVAERWIARDGDAEAFRSFCAASFAAMPSTDPLPKLSGFFDRSCAA